MGSPDITLGSFQLSLNMWMESIYQPIAESLPVWQVYVASQVIYVQKFQTVILSRDIISIPEPNQDRYWVEDPRMLAAIGRIKEIQESRPGRSVQWIMNDIYSVFVESNSINLFTIHRISYLVRWPCVSDGQADKLISLWLKHIWLWRCCEVQGGAQPSPAQPSPARVTATVTYYTDNIILISHLISLNQSISLFN